MLSAIAKELGCETRLFDTTRFDFGCVDNTKAGEAAKMFKPVNLEKYGHKKKKLDLSDEFLKALKDFKPNCLAFSVLNDEYMVAKEISDIAKSACSDIPIIWGGKFPTICPEKALDIVSVDFICLGEGIEAFADFIKSFQSGKSLYNINNIWAKKRKKIIRNEIRPLKNNLDDLPYLDWEIFDRSQFYRPFNGRAYRSGDHTLNWGCPKQCTYCNNYFFHSLYNNKYFMRRYSIKRIIEELKYLKKVYNLEFFTFLDEDFLMRPAEELRDLSEAYSHEVNLPNTIMTNPKSVSKEKVGYLKRMNCVNASVGIEIGDLALRAKLLKRVDSKEDIIRAFSLLTNAGIRTSSFNLLGIPFETRQTYDKTVQLNREAGVQYPYIGFFYPFEGTELRDIAIKEGFFDAGTGDYIPYYRDKPALKFDNLAEEELIEMRNVFVLYIKLPKYYAPYIRRSEKQDNEGIALRKKLLEIYDRTVWANNGWFKDDGNREKYLSELKMID